MAHYPISPVGGRLLVKGRAVVLADQEMVLKMFIGNDPKQEEVML